MHLRENSVLNKTVGVKTKAKKMKTTGRLGNRETISAAKQ
jgi:hypothetical protein